MNTVIITFRSRTDSMRISEMLYKSGVSNRLVNTPRELSLGCGISVLIDENSLPSARTILSALHRSSFVGIYRIEQEGLSKTITPI